MIKRNKNISKLLIIAMCTSIINISSVSAATTTENGLTIKNNTLTECDKNASGEIVIPDNVKWIKQSAFEKCNEITKITIPSSVSEIKNETFKECKNLKEVVIEDGVKSIGYEAFAYCKSLEKINIPKTVKEIDDHAFEGCKNLADIDIKTSTQNIGIDVFKDTKWSENESEDGFLIVNDVLLDVDNDEVDKDAEIPGNVEIIGAFAFQECTTLKTLKMSNSVKEIRHNAFEGCTKLKTIKLSNKLKTIGAGAFRSCSSLTEVNIPDSVTTIPKDTFNTSTKLTGNTKVYEAAMKDTPAIATDKNFYVDAHRYNAGWNEIPEGKFYINSNGTLHTGWMTENGKKYYFYSN